MGREPGSGAPCRLSVAQGSANILPPNGGSVDLPSAVEALRANGADRVVLKVLAPNDNSKNQVYIGGGEAALRDLRVDLEQAEVTGEGNRTALRVDQPTRWMDDSGQLAPAPTNKVIFYPQYPEARMSGFARGVPRGFGGRDLLVERDEGRVMLLGLRGDEWLIWVGRPNLDQLEALELRDLPRNPFREVLAGDAATSDAIWSDLLTRVTELTAGPPLPSVKLTSSGALLPTSPTAPHASGYALEAALGIPVNATPGPDFRGLVELKTFTGGRLSLMTPEPTGGIYVDPGKTEFLTRWGVRSKNGRKVRFNGQHRLNETKSTNPLLLTVDGWSEESPGRYDPTGALVLRDPRTGENAASWQLRDMNGQWMKKHPEALYVQYERDSGGFRLTGRLVVCQGTEFRLFMLGLRAGVAFLDPGHSMDLATGSVHARSQWRTARNGLLALYEKVTYIEP